MPGIIGQKLGMSQVLQDDGRVIPVTFVKCSPNTIVQVKTKEKDGYPALVLGFDAYKNPSKNKKFKMVREFRVEKPENYQKDQKFELKGLEGIKAVTVTSQSKGKGMQGVVRKYHFAGGPATHGSTFHREPGAVGARSKPGRVHKGKHLPGHMGYEQVTLKDRPVILLAPDKELIAIKGPIPGPNKGYVFLKF
ncbi:50S ribosomal protein L3 [Candidatus Peregrinibacteria bacterium]|nr:50S ribosomal protein L3 [Candidatus Peregrinibacteria bacterium]